MKRRVTEYELDGLCSHAYKVKNFIAYAAFRELIELRALRDGKPAFIPTVIGEAAQAGAVTNDLENQP